MRSTLAIVLGAVVVVLCGTLSVVLGDLLLCIVLLACSVLMAFLVGLGVGERSRAAFNQDVMRINRLLGEQNQALCEANLRLLRDAAPSQANAKESLTQPIISEAEPPLPSSKSTLP